MADNRPLSDAERRMIEEFERDIGVTIVETISIEKHLTEDERERLEADSLSIYSAPETIRTVQIVERKEKRMPSTAEVALTLGVTKNTVSGLVCQGKLESAGHGQITDESLGKYLANRKANGGVVAKSRLKKWQTNQRQSKNGTVAYKVRQEQYRAGLNR